MKFNRSNWIMVVNENTELRKLRPAEIYNLALILNPSNNWKKLMGSVTKEESEEVFKFSSECASIIEQASYQECKPAAAIFLEEWATMGMKRPTLGLLLKLLMKLELFRAADYLAEEILKVQTPQRPNFGPAVAIDAEEVLVHILRKQNLQPQTDYQDSDIHKATTSEIHLSQINYPMHMLEDTSISDNNFALGDNNTGVLEMHFDQPKSNQNLDNERCSKNYKLVPDEKNCSNVTSKTLKTMNNNVHDAINSNKAKSINLTNTDLITFSVSSDFKKLQHKQYSERHWRSDLMKFDSEKIDINKVNEVNTEVSKGNLPDLNILCPNCLTKHEPISINDDNFSKNQFSDHSNMNANCSIGEARKIFSPKLSKNDENLVDSKYFHRELISAELPLCINERNELNSNATTLSVENLSTNASQSLSINSSKNSNDSSMNNGFSDTDIPCSIVEAESREQIVEQDKNLFKYRGVNHAMNSEELPVMVLDFQKP